MCDPLVSIIIITYNSSDYVLETLESAKDQSYRNIELIVSDDGSTDDTVEICRKWIDEHKYRFINTKLLSVTFNTGIPANCNRGIHVSSGVWIKLIAGDDMLLGNCIKDCLDYIYSQPQHITALYTNMNVFENTFNSENFKYVADYSKSKFNRPGILPKEQLSLLLRDVFYIGAPSFFIKKGLIIELGGYDEEMPFEDWPMYLKILNKGLKIYHFNQVTVNYRLHNLSIYNMNTFDQFIYNDFFIKERMVYQKYRREYLTRIERLNEDMEFNRKKIGLKYGLNRKNKFNILLDNFFRFIYSCLKMISSKCNVYSK